MSEKLGITVKQYQRLEYGDYPISSRNLFRIAKRMGVPVKRLVQ
jgi:transcriptional regulator with XRE-family HTH domain